MESNKFTFIYTDDLISAINQILDTWDKITGDEKNLITVHALAKV